ncbi:MAG: Gfo/Idh/MocA family oxidoreductase [Pontibacterium sp.]
MINIAVVGASGAFGKKHLEALASVKGARLVATADLTPTAHPTDQSIHHYDSLNALLSDPALKCDAVILATPTPLHAEQALACIAADKHVLVEIPMADSLADAQALLTAAANKPHLCAMVGHVRRFNPSHQWIHQQISQGKLTLQHLQATTYFFRRSNTNALGEPRSWTDHLLWHHACHTVDLFLHQTHQAPCQGFALAGPTQPELGIAMDMTIGLKSDSGSLCSLALSFNNEGPFGTEFRYICDKGTYIARYDDLVDGEGTPIDLSEVSEISNGIALIDQAFVDSISTGKPNAASFEHAFGAMQVLAELSEQLETG